MSDLARARALLLFLAAPCLSASSVMSFFSPGGTVSACADAQCCQTVLQLLRTMSADVHTLESMRAGVRDLMTMWALSPCRVGPC